MDWINLIAVLGSAIAIISFFYTIFRNFKEDINRKFEIQDKKFESFERRFELLDNRIFQVVMGKSLKEILESEKQSEKIKGE